MNNGQCYEDKRLALIIGDENTSDLNTTYFSLESCIHKMLKEAGDKGVLLSKLEVTPSLEIAGIYEVKIRGII